MSAQYENVKKLLARLDDETLAHKLCSCFVDAPSEAEARRKIQEVIAKQQATKSDRSE